jgi:hypothetical protein
MIRVLTGVIGLVFVFSGLALYVLHFTRNPGNQMEASVPKARKTSRGYASRVFMDSMIL